MPTPHPVPDESTRPARAADSFDDFYRATCRRVLHHVYALTGDLAEAQDCVQEAYARAWQRWSRVRGHDDPEAWVRTVARRIAVSRWRRTRTAMGYLLHHGRPETTAAPSEDHALLVRALRDLSQPQRDAVVLHHLVGLSVEEVAQRTASPVGTVKARLHRGRAALAHVIGDLDPPPNPPAPNPSAATGPPPNLPAPSPAQQNQDQPAQRPQTIQDDVRTQSDGRTQDDQRPQRAQHRRDTPNDRAIQPRHDQFPRQTQDIQDDEHTQGDGHIQPQHDQHPQQDWGTQAQHAQNTQRVQHHGDTPDDGGTQPQPDQFLQQTQGSWDDGDAQDVGRIQKQPDQYPQHVQGSGGTLRDRTPADEENRHDQ